MTEKDRLLTPCEVAQVFNVSTVTVWRWIKGNKIKAAKIGLRYYISQQAVDALRKGKYHGR